MNSHYSDLMESPLGTLYIAANDDGITVIKFLDKLSSEERHHATGNHTSCEIIESAKAQLSEYFAGERTEFSLPLAAQGTKFQHAVWAALLTVKFGQTASYSDIAKQLDNPNAVRAVGAANGKNPISIVVPCHRVIGKNGTLTGYAGGLSRKQKLLALEWETQK